MQAKVNLPILVEEKHSMEKVIGVLIMTRLEMF